MKLGLHVGSLKTEVRTVSHCWMHLDSFLLVELPCLVSVGEELKSLLLFMVIGPATICYINNHYKNLTFIEADMLYSGRLGWCPCPVT